MAGRGDQPRVIIVGAGIIGASVAYHLSNLGYRSTVIEQCTVACAASGKSGGFLAKDWCDSSPLKHLARPSYQMHSDYSAKFGDRIAYRTMSSYSVSLVNPDSRTARLQPMAKVPKDLSWLNGSANVVHRVSQIGETTTNAQVLPKNLTNALLEAATEAVGTDIIISTVKHVTKDTDDQWSLTLSEGNNNERSVKCDILVLCMGPWTIQAQKWFPSLPAIMAHKAASLVVKAKVAATALFTEYVNSQGEVRSPEAYPRHDEVYMCQSAIPDDLPANPSDIRISTNDLTNLQEFAGAISADLGVYAKDERRTVAQACNLPISPDGLPIIGAIPNTGRTAYVAAGHSCWGILNSPATGLAIAEMIVTGTTTVKIKAFDPARFS